VRPLAIKTASKRAQRGQRTEPCQARRCRRGLLHARNRRATVCPPPLACRRQVRSSRPLCCWRRHRLFQQRCGLPGIRTRDVAEAETEHWMRGGHATTVQRKQTGVGTTRKPTHYRFTPSRRRPRGTALLRRFHYRTSPTGMSRTEATTSPAAAEAWERFPCVSPAALIARKKTAPIVRLKSSNNSFIVFPPHLL
jgi:hypothetical protein